MPGLRIVTPNFVHTVLESPRETIFDMHQERDALRYIEGSVSAAANRSSALFLANLNTRCPPKLIYAAAYAFSPGG